MTDQEIFLKRRSIRKYADREVPEESVTTLLKAGMAAPSAGNEQPWEFMVIRKRETLDKLMEIHPHAGMLRQAGTAILVCANLSRVKYSGFWIQDCSAATENILLSAVSVGLGSVWLGVYPETDRVRGFQKLFSLPEQVIPFSLVPLGFAKEEKASKDRFDSSRVHFETW